MNRKWIVRIPSQDFIFGNTDPTSDNVSARNLFVQQSDEVLNLNGPTDITENDSNLLDQSTPSNQFVNDNGIMGEGNDLDNIQQQLGMSHEQQQNQQHQQIHGEGQPDNLQFDPINEFLPQNDLWDPVYGDTGNGISHSQEQTDFDMNLGLQNTIENGNFAGFPQQAHSQPQLHQQIQPNTFNSMDYGFSIQNTHASRIQHDFNSNSASRNQSRTDFRNFEGPPVSANSHVDPLNAGYSDASFLPSPGNLSGSDEYSVSSRDSATIKRETGITHSALQQASARLDPVFARRLRYKVKSSIPKNLPRKKYADECIEAAKVSQLSPFRLHIEEYNLLRAHISHAHVTAYLNIRNGILRLWVLNPKTYLTMEDAAGCANDERYFALAEVAYEWLFRFGYINFGCYDVPDDSGYPRHKSIKNDNKKPRLTIGIVGAGMAGLSCARHLEYLFRHNRRKFDDYEDLPRIVIVEGRRRIGGRINSATLKTDRKCAVDLGGHVIMGYQQGNPLSIVIEKQLRLPVSEMKPPEFLLDAVTRDRVSKESKNRSDLFFAHVLDKVAKYKHELPEVMTSTGDINLIEAGKYPPVVGYTDEYTVIAKLEEAGELIPPQVPEEEDTEISEDHPSMRDMKEEIDYLKSIGFTLKEGVTPKPYMCKINPLPPGEMYPSLGRTIHGYLTNVAQFIDFSDEDFRLLNWQVANLEYSTGVNFNELSLGSWNQDDSHKMAGKHVMLDKGMSTLIHGLYSYPEKLDVRFKMPAKVIEYDENLAHIYLENGDRLEADRTVITVPLGVLKDRAIEFIPDLPQWKIDSINHVGYGVVNKVCLIYETAFWDESKGIFCLVNGPNPSSDDQDFANTRGEYFMFWNSTEVVGKPCLVGIITGDSAKNMANETDEVILKAAQDHLDVLFPGKGNTDPEEYFVSRWQIDPYARGSYSYMGLEATGADFDLLAKPIGDSLFFAGEATCRNYPGTMHGSFMSGLRAANEVITSLIGEIEIPYPLVPDTKDYLLNHNDAHPHQHHHQLHHHRHHHHIGSHHSSSSSLGVPRSHARVRMEESRTSNFSSSRERSTSAGGNTNGGNNITNGVNINGKRRLEDTEEENPNIDDDEVSRRQAAEQRLLDLRNIRMGNDSERMRHDLVKELGERPLKPELDLTNPFLLFQKDFWEKSREKSDEEKRKATNNPNAKATRNEVRRMLGQMWRELPEESKEPYLKQTRDNKEANMAPAEEFKRKLKQYDADAEDFRRRWRIEHGTPPSEEELELARYLHGSMSESEWNKSKHHLYYNKWL